jgi:hypothetical protein
MPVAKHQHRAAAKRPVGIVDAVCSDFVDQMQGVDEQALPWDRLQPARATTRAQRQARWFHPHTRRGE